MPTRLVFAVSEFTAKRNEEAKKFQGKRPAYANTGYGAPSSRSSYCPGSRKFVTTVRPLAGSGAVVSTISPYARGFDDQTTTPAFEVSARGCPRWST